VELRKVGLVGPRPWLRRLLPQNAAGAAVEDGPGESGLRVERVRVVAQTEKELAQLLAHLGLGLPQRTKRVRNVVLKNASHSSPVTANQAKRFPD